MPGYMGFIDVKKQVIECLKQGNYSHEIREDIDVKNSLLTGQVSEELVIELIKCCSGSQHQQSLHHQVSSIMVHILKPVKDNKKWYIKFYFLEPDVMFISVHESEN